MGSISQRLKNKREELNLSQAQLKAASVSLAAVQPICCWRMVDT